MNYSQDIETAREIAGKVLERIESEGLTPAPPTYELWYVYYAGLNPEVARSIDILCEAGQKITDERCFELHQRFLSESKENERVKQAGDQIQEAIKSVGGLVTSVKSATSDYNTQLATASEKLANEDLDIVDAREAIDGVVSATRNMIQENSRLEQELSKSNEVMRDLKRDLELIRKQALTDGLTNVANRKAFDNEIVRIRDEAKAAGTGFCLAMLDIDHFKTFNDNYGHQIGDQVLRLVAKTLFDGVKGRDIVARFGGEEFAIVLPETELRGGVKLADLLRKAVASKEVVNRNTGEKLGRITLSGGVAEFDGNETVDEIIDRADKALYSAKHNGRNQIASSATSDQKKAAS